MSDFKFDDCSFSASQFGDNNKMLYVNKKEIQNELESLRESVALDNSIISSNRDKIQSLLMKLKKEIEQPHTDSKAQSLWNEIKEGLKTSAALAGIVATITKLLGF